MRLPTRAAMVIGALLAAVLAAGSSRAESPLIDSQFTVPVHGDPSRSPKYIQNAVQAVGISGWGGPFRLDSAVAEGLPAGSIYLERGAAHLDADPLANSSIALNVVFKSAEAATSTLARLGRRGAYAYYVGPGGYIFPTLLSDTTAPALCATLRKALERERTNAVAARNTGLHLLAWFIGARNPVQLKLPTVTGLEAFTTTEQAIILEARRILTSPAFARLRAAHTIRTSATVKLAGRVIQYEPGAPVSGMTLFGENGFLIGREAFRHEAELVKTVLHELHRLSTSTVRVEGATMATVRIETLAAKTFADRAFKATLQGLER